MAGIAYCLDDWEGQSDFRLVTLAVKEASGRLHF